MSDGKRVSVPIPGGSLVCRVPDEVAGELLRLSHLATRWYLADGTFEVLPEDEVIRRRKEAAKTLIEIDRLRSHASELAAIVEAADLMWSELVEYHKFRTRRNWQVLICAGRKYDAVRNALKEGK